MSNKRRFFIVGWSDSLDFAMFADAAATDTVSYWLQLIPPALNAQLETDDEKVGVLVPGESCLLFDWNLEELPPGIRVNQIPKPGVVFAVRKGTQLDFAESEADPTESDDSSYPNQAESSTSGETTAQITERKSKNAGGEFGFAYMLKQELWRGDSKYAKRLQAFLAAPEAAYEPLPITRFDAFISYSSQDLALATEITTDLEARKLCAFLASRDLAVGTMWTEEVRQALLASRVLLIILTPNSVTRPWVMCEVGASWALGKPLIPALLYVDPKTLPEVVTSYQCLRIETAKGRKELVDELARLCLVGP